SQAFGIETTEISSFNAMEIAETAGPVVALVRQQVRPQTLIINGYRFCHHSKSDDYRDAAEIEKWKLNDPVETLKKEISSAAYEALDRKATERVLAAENFGRQAPFPTLDRTSLDEAL